MYSSNLDEGVRSGITDDLQTLFSDSTSVQILDENTLVFSADIEAATANELIGAVYEMDKVLGCETEPIRLLFSTNGGDVNEAMRIINILKYAIKRPIHIYATGYVYSAGVSILAALEHRFAFPYTFFMIHSVRLSLNDNVSLQSLKASHAALLRLEQSMNQVLVDIGAFSDEELKTKLEGDYMFTVEEALERGLITKVAKSTDFDKKVECFSGVDGTEKINNNKVGG